jgi:translation initiation factor 2 subunit 3
LGPSGTSTTERPTLTKALTGVWTDRHSEEVKRGISIKLGYADATFYLCERCGAPEGYTTKAKCPRCEHTTRFLRTVSFVDSPGHETLMAIMLSGAAIMDGAMLVIAANEPCPQPQTKEHLMALDIVGAKNIVIVQNKVDLVSEEKARRNYEEILQFVRGTVAEGAPIIPISAHHEVNINMLIAALEEIVPSPKRDPSEEAVMFTARSFDVNRPGTPPPDLLGGVIGGSIVQGVLRVGEEIEIAPGREVEERAGRKTWVPIRTKIRSLHCGGKAVDHADPGGLVAIGTGLDPAMTKADSLSGRVVGKPGKLPPLWDKFTLDLSLLAKVVGTSDDTAVEPVKTREPLMLSVGTATTVGVVTSARESSAEMSLKLPVCATLGQRIAISRRVGGRWRLIGHGILKA